MASRQVTLGAMAVVVAVATLLPATASAASYTVGDGSGWDIGIDYHAWASGKKFRVGDTLEFLYSLGEAEHNVVLVDAQSFAACTVPSNAPTLTTGDDTVSLTQAGQWFFICGIEGHCQDGMKLAVNVQ
ncbi:basic blue protein-like [Hordeum vulgare subsp. vulgare]|uniref:Phytocyanin domain-containing protein n=1 Tax=Hordeum vulgare subsp. vulgare TaxID=112509 RepID=A0A8I7BA10_HORVV|nr:basic blue protein-like [Hordeum vulgare subsp. vulgare]